MATARTALLADDADIPTAANAGLLALVIGANLVCGLALPLVLLPASAYWLLLLVPFTALTVAHWGLIHEAVHGHLHPRRGLNEAFGRALSVLFGGSFAVLRFGHLSHHSLNSRPSDRPELYDPAAVPRWRATVLFYLRLLWGIYLAEFLSALACFLPRRPLTRLVRRLFYEGHEDARGMAERAERQLLEPRQLARIRFDSGLALAWLALSLFLYGSAAWALGLALVGRGVVVSFMDNAPHYAGEVEDPGQGYDMQAPRLAAPLIMNTNLHGTHHRHPNLPWTALPAAHEAGGTGYAGSYFTVPLRQLKGPIPHPPPPDLPAGRTEAQAA